MFFVLLVLFVEIAQVKGYFLGSFSSFVNGRKASRVCNSPVASSESYASPLDYVSDQLALSFGGLEPHSIYYTNFDITGGRSMETTMLVGDGSTLSAKLKEINLTKEQREKVKWQIQNTSIIANASVVLEYEYLSSCVLENVQSLMTATDLVDRPEATRNVPVHTLVRGSGCGKTRGLEECRMSILLGFVDWFAMSTTFNHKTLCRIEYEYPDVPLNVHTPSNLAKGRYALELASALAERMLKTFYGFPKKPDVVPLIQLIVRNITSSGELADVDAVRALLHGTVKHMVLRITEKNPAKMITRFTLMVDEIMKYLEMRKIEDEDIEGVVSIIREAVLDDRVWINKTYSVGTSLVISSLSAHISGATDSGREERIFKLTDKLFPEEIVDRLWRQTMIDKTNATEMTLFNETYRGPLLLLASSVNSVPRMVECIGNGLSENIRILRNVSAPKTPKVDGTNENFHKLKFPIRDPPKGGLLLNNDERRYFGKVIQTALGTLSAKFGNPEPLQVCPKLLHALCFQNLVPLAEDTVQCVRMSIFTNLLDTFNRAKKITLFRPEGCLMYLASRFASARNSLVNDVLFGLRRYSDHVVECLHAEDFKIGELLEILLYDALDTWVCAEKMQHSDEEEEPEFAGLTSLSRLLRVDCAKTTAPGCDFVPMTRNGRRWEGEEDWTTFMEEGAEEEIPFGDLPFSPTNWKYKNVTRFPPHSNRSGFFKAMSRKSKPVEIFRSYDRSIEAKNCSSEEKKRSKESKNFTNEANNEDDSYDVGMLVTPTTGDSEAFAVFVECKSRDEKGLDWKGPFSVVHYNEKRVRKDDQKLKKMNKLSMMEKLKMTNSTKNPSQLKTANLTEVKRPALRQFRRMCNVTFDLTTPEYDGMKGKYVEALRNGRWLYVYLTTDDVEDYFVDGKQLPFDGNFTDYDKKRTFLSASSTGKVLVLGKKTTLKFFSFLSGSYQAARALWNKE